MSLFQSVRAVSELVHHRAGVVRPQPAFWICVMRQDAAIVFPVVESADFVPLLGALFLASLVTIPNIRSSYGFGVTSLLILVGVTVDTSRQIQTLLINESYQKN
mgnify:CR=1 FL=1